MTVAVTNAVTNMAVDTEIKQAWAAIDLPDVREMMRKLSAYNLGICIPHMHREDVDFGKLPADTVQVEEDCHVRWVARTELDSMPNSVPVAWRWMDDGIVADAECIQTCTPSNSPKKSHRKGHL